MFEWDDVKNRRNVAKHGVNFELAATIFAGPVLTALDDRNDYGEPRFVSIGSVGGTVILTVVHTDRDGVVRLISARRASRKERMIYEGSTRQGADRRGTGGDAR